MLTESGPGPWRTRTWCLTARTTWLSSTSSSCPATSSARHSWWAQHDRTCSVSDVVCQRALKSSLSDEACVYQRSAATVAWRRSAASDTSCGAVLRGRAPRSARCGRGRPGATAHRRRYRHHRQWMYVYTYSALFFWFFFEIAIHLF